MAFIDSDYRCLSRTDLVRTLSFMHRCLSSASTEAFNRAILEFAAGLGFEFVLYGYTQTPYRVPEEARVINLSNPVDWAREYEREHLLHDPALHEVRLRIEDGEKSSYFLWNNYTWPLGPPNHRSGHLFHWRIIPIQTILGACREVLPADLHDSQQQYLSLFRTILTLRPPAKPQQVGYRLPQSF